MNYSNYCHLTDEETKVQSLNILLTDIQVKDWKKDFEFRWSHLTHSKYRFCGKKQQENQKLKKYQQVIMLPVHSAA
jgi:hypothetical protein